jgi:hypothetical protein
MEKEVFLSGYCRTTDNSRMVEVIVEDGVVTEVDCCYENCPHTANCLIAKSIRELTES